MQLYGDSKFLGQREYEEAKIENIERAYAEGRWKDFHKLVNLAAKIKI